MTVGGSSGKKGENGPDDSSKDLSKKNSEPIKEESEEDIKKREI